jgi:hypothetical protein
MKPRVAASLKDLSLAKELFVIKMAYKEFVEVYNSVNLIKLRIKKDLRLDHADILRN